MPCKAKAKTILDAFASVAPYESDPKGINADELRYKIIQIFV
jgi:hypothetical protein